MVTCNDFETYLNRQMTVAERVIFEDHLKSCARCKAMLMSSKRVHLALEQLWDDQVPSPSVFGAKALIERARASSEERTLKGISSGLVIKVGLAGALLVLIALIARQLILPLRSNAPDEQVKRTDFETIAASEQEGRVFRIGQTQFGLGLASRVRVNRASEEVIQLDLLSGTMGVEHPESERNRSLSIRVGVFEIKVKGTRFWASKGARSSVQVGVVRGKVEVSQPSGVLAELSAGEKLDIQRIGDRVIEKVEANDEAALDRLFVPESREGSGVEREKPPASRTALPEIKKSPDLASIEQWILDGQLERSERALLGRLAVSPKDMPALWLLATCERKAGKFKEAVKTYQQIIDNGAPEDRNRARFKAGVLLQDQIGQHQDAVQLFDVYLQAPPDERPNTVEARIRLARSLERLGQKERYREILRAIVEEHGGTEEAARARRQLELLGEEFKHNE